MYYFLYLKSTDHIIMRKWSDDVLVSPIYHKYLVLSCFYIIFE